MVSTKLSTYMMVFVLVGLVLVSCSPPSAPKPTPVILTPTEEHTVTPVTPTATSVPKLPLIRVSPPYTAPGPYPVELKRIS